MASDSTSKHLPEIIIFGVSFVLYIFWGISGTRSKIRYLSDDIDLFLLAFIFAVLFVIQFKFVRTASQKLFKNISKGKYVEKLISYSIVPGFIASFVYFTIYSEMTCRRDWCLGILTSWFPAFFAVIPLVVVNVVVIMLFNHYMPQTGPKGDVDEQKSSPKELKGKNLRKKIFQSVVFYILLAIVVVCFLIVFFPIYILSSIG